MEMAIWSVPREGAALGFAILMSASNAGGSVGDILTSSIVDYLPIGFTGLTKLCGLLAASALCVVPILPSELFDRTPESERQ
jgi:hypothetical protein